MHLWQLQLAGTSLGFHGTGVPMGNKGKQLSGEVNSLIDLEYIEEGQKQLICSNGSEFSKKEQSRHILSSRMWRKVGKEMKVKGEFEYGSPSASHHGVF